MSRRQFGVGLGVVGAMAVGACAPSSGSSPKPVSTSAARTDIAGDAPVTLKFLDYSAWIRRGGGWVVTVECPCDQRGWDLRRYRSAREQGHPVDASLAQRFG